MWSFYLHRLTGVGVFCFLLLHIVDASLVGWGPSAYNAVQAVYSTVVFRVGELLLIGAVVYHGLNGIRLMLFDFWVPATHYQLRLAQLVFLVSGLVMIPTAYVVLRPLLQLGP